MKKGKKGKTFFVSTFLDCYTSSKKSLEKVDTSSKKSLGKVDALSKKSLEKVLALDYTLDILDKELKSYAEKKS